MIGVTKSEFVKISSFPLCMVGIIGSVFIAPTVIFFTGFDTANIVGVLAEDIVSQSLRSLMLGQVGAVILAAGLFGQEYDQSCLRTTFLAVPKRLKLLSAKLIALTIVVMFTGIISGALSLVVGIIRFGIMVNSELVLWYMIKVICAMVSWIQISWLCAAISVLTKTLITPIAVMLPLILGLSQMLYSFLNLAKLLPDLATINLFLGSEVPGFLNIGGGILVQFVWVLLFATAATSITLYRDVR